MSHVLQTRKDLEEKDEQRHEEFKQYEMQKKFEEEQKMKGNTDSEGKRNRWLKLLVC